MTSENLYWASGGRLVWKTNCFCRKLPPMKTLTLKAIVIATLAASASAQKVDFQLKAQVVPTNGTSLPRYELRDLGRRLGPNVSSGVAKINNSGLMAGYVDPADEQIGTLPYLFWHGRIRSIGLLQGGYTSGGVTDINESGD